MVEIVDLYKSFDNKMVLNGVNLKINRGETFALIGASGNGKSVLLKHMSGLMKPDRGKILIDGQDISCLYGKKLKKLKDRIGVVFQFGALFDSLTVYDNVAFPLVEKTKLSAAEIDKKVLEELDIVGLTGEGHKFPAQISGGMRKRVAVARCLVMNPEIIFFDEPTTGLDPVIANSIYRTIKSLQEQRNLTSFIISHEIPGIFKIADRVAMLHEGRIVQVGTSEEIINTNNITVRKFLQGEIE
ncbi:MAG: ATP-binding cassette domain-containing protein [Candidatus Omnitrophica bacterium]|nr:ATP-binding cassette domain-containing protein [Candidatus Omnitrophota bacterium]